MSDSDFSLSKSTKKDTVIKLSLIGAALVFLAACLLIYFLVIVPRPKSGEKRVNLVIEYADKSYDYEVFTEAGTVKALLEGANEDCVLGVEMDSTSFLTGLKGVSTPADWSAYYTFFVVPQSVGYTAGDNVADYYSMVGAADAAIAEGDTVIFRYVSWVDGADVLAEGKPSSDYDVPKDKAPVIFFSVAGGVLVLAAGAFVLVRVASKKKGG